MFTVHNYPAIIKQGSLCKGETMIFWATVISFMIGIMTFMLYPREDQIKTVHLPASEAYIASFVTQHQAAKDYLREGLVALQKLPEHATNSDENDSILALSGEASGGTGIESPLINFLTPSQSIMTTSKFQPEVSAENNGGFVSVLGCFTRPERKIENTYVESDLRECVSDTAQTKYVFTYGPLPYFDNDLYMRNKTLLWEAAILKRTHGSPDCGFLEKDVKRKAFDKDGNAIMIGTDQYFVNNSSRLTRKVPSKFAAFLDKNAYLTTMEECDKTGGRPSDKNRDDKNRIVLSSDCSPVLFCMTPANDPYPQTGLIINYDSKINTGEAGFHAVKTEDLNTEGSDSIWTNLGRGITHASTGAVIAKGDGKIKFSGSSSDNWHDVRPDSTYSCGQDCLALNNPKDILACDAYNLECSNPSFTMDNRTIDTGIKPEQFGNSFTISFLAKLNVENASSQYAVFGTEVSCTPAAGRPCLRAWVAQSGSQPQITFELKESDTKVSQVSANLSSTKSQFDYIVSPGGHKLYVDGSLIHQDSFGIDKAISEIAGLNGDNFVIGKDATISNTGKGSLYNFLVYKRSMTTDDAITGGQGIQSAEKFDVQGLGRVHKSNSTRYRNFK